MREEIKKVAPKDIPVLIEGPPGTGKELVAKELHKHSPRKDRKFVAVDCGAIAPGLFESEMFGYVKGAFTDASPHGKEGYVKAAESGEVITVFTGKRVLPSWRNEPKKNQC